MRDIAAEAGVSKGLVSMILSGTPGPSAESAARVLAIADRLGYRADRTASLLKRRRSHLLGVTVEPSNSFHGELAEEIQRVADGRGYEIVLGPVTPVHDERRAIETLLGFRCEALLLLGSGLPPGTLLEVTQGVPTVSVGRPVNLAEFDVVRADDRAGIAMAVDHLRRLGHRVIAHADGGTGFVARERREAYRAAMRRHGLQPLVVSGGPAEIGGIKAAQRLEELAGITAVIAFNDKCAIGILDHLDRRHVPVPAAMSVIGFDDTFASQLQRIDLTSINQAHRQQAPLAVAAAIERLDGGRTERLEQVLAPELVIRGSTGPAPQP